MAPERMGPSRERQHLLPGDYDSDDIVSLGRRTRFAYWHFPPIFTRYTMTMFLGMLCALVVFTAVVRVGLSADPISLQARSYASDIAKQVKSSMNTSADPCTNFYEYACGGWISNATLPADKDTYARSFTEISDRNINILHDIVKSASHAGDDRVGTMWQSCMDETAIEEAGMDPLFEQIKGISSISNLNDFFAQLGLMERKHEGFFFNIAVEVDAKNTSRHIVAIHQAGLTMGDRFRYVVPETNRSAELQKHFKRIQPLANLKMSQSGISIAAAIQSVVNLEIQIAQFTKPNEDLRDPIATYNLRTIQDCSRESGLDFLQYFRNMGFTSLTESSYVNIENPDFLTKMGELLRSAPLPLLKDAVMLRTMVSMSNILPRNVRNEHFHFFSTQLRGIKEQQPRWKQCIIFMDQLLGDDLGQRFLKQIDFSDKQKRLAVSLVDSVIDQFKESLKHVPWMDKSTQQAAIDKIAMHKIKVLMGYPKTWMNYDSLNLDLGKFADNVLRSRNFLIDDFIARLSKPVDPYRFLMTVPTVNAYYEPTLNSMNFPAGILQLPFFTSEQSVPSAFNYGGIGTVMGHELVHAFDDQGRQYDGDGVLNPWWPEQVAERFKERSKCLGKQYASFEFEGEFRIKPELTMGENIADNGGVSVAFKAFLKKGDLDKELIPGISNRKLFWIAMAQNWCQIQTKERLINQLSTDPHSPPLARVHVPLMNNEEFAQDFQCPIGSKLNPAERCIIW